MRVLRLDGDLKNVDEMGIAFRYSDRHPRALIMMKVIIMIVVTPTP
jgi:hypothetical protein